MKLITAISKVKFINKNLGFMYPEYVYTGGYSGKDMLSMVRFIDDYYEEAMDIVKEKRKSVMKAYDVIAGGDDDYEKLQNLYY